MRRRGIWLLDASIVALNHEEDEISRQTALDISWREYIRPTLDDLKPECVIGIERGVGEALRVRLSELPFHVEFPAQPWARLPAEGDVRQYQRYYELCMAYAR